MWFEKKRGVQLSLLLFTCVILASALVYAGGSKGGGSSPPPPTCSTLSQGCYTSGGKLSSGPVGRDSFGHFYPERVCLADGNCNCPGTASLRKSDAITNPNQDFGACSCIQGAQYDANAGCCGDHVDDCGKVTNGILCSMNANLITEGWFESGLYEGRIIYVGCRGQNREFLSTGQTWRKCDEFEKYTVANHQYLCTGRTGKGAWHECCGEEACNSANGGVQLLPGESVFADNKRHYCTANARFVDDLDSDKSACEGANFEWTGNQCCGDEDGEYYIDVEDSCWDGQPISGGKVTNTDDGVLAIKDSQVDFYGCNLEETQPSLRSLTNSRNNAPLINDQKDFDFCALAPTINFFCAYGGKWTDTGGDTSIVDSAVPTGITVAQPNGCCSATSCWNGSLCISDQSQTAGDLAQYLGDYRCHGGTWEQPSLKASADGTQKGYCPRSDQCLVTTSGQSADNNNPTGNPQCISDLQYQNDRLCTDGNWSSRTRAIALELLDLVDTSGEDFTLFCDEPENTLNEQDAILGSNDNTFFRANVNKVCVLKRETQTIMGTSFNTQLQNEHFRAIYNVNSCTGSDDGLYAECTQQLRYNKKLESVLYSQQPLTLQGNPSTLRDRFITLIWDLLLPVIDLVRDNPHESLNRLDGIYHFNRLYVSKQGSEEITAVLDIGTEPNIIIRYRGFSSDICALTKPFLPQDNSGISCIKNNNDYILHLQGTSVRNFDPVQFWADVGAKLR